MSEQDHDSIWKRVILCEMLVWRIVCDGGARVYESLQLHGVIETADD
jgi:hypothetical protein